MSPLDASTADVAAVSAASLAISENQMSEHGCWFDPEDPNCSKVILSGVMRKQVLPPASSHVLSDDIKSHAPLNGYIMCFH